MVERCRISDYLGDCVRFVVGFRATAGVGGDLRVEGKEGSMEVLPDLLVLVSSVPDRDDVAALVASNVTIQSGG